MERTERIYKISQMLQRNRVVPKERFLDILEISLATFKRDLEYLRDRLGAPIVWDREYRGYRFDESDSNAGFELPGMWFNDSEIYVLLIMEHLLENLQPGLLAPQITPLKSQIRALLEKGDHSYDEIQNRIKVLPQAARDFELSAFEVVSKALLSRKRLELEHYSRQRDKTQKRVVSPQRLVHYRDNWYLDAWCHLRNDLRTFSVDTIQSAVITDNHAKSVSNKKLDDVLMPGYGIFSGKDTQQAKLRFTPERARWISNEKWHPEQKTYFDDDGFYWLEIPYSNEHELIMDILKFGPDVNVEAPYELKNSVKTKLKAALAQY